MNMNTVKSYDGKNDIDIKACQESYDRWPGDIRRAINDKGEAFLTGVVSTESKCGCRVIGNGSLQFPLSISFCKQHLNQNV